jgi:hypothetical protein
MKHLKYFEGFFDNLLDDVFSAADHVFGDFIPDKSYKQENDQNEQGEFPGKVIDKKTSPGIRGENYILRVKFDTGFTKDCRVDKDRYDFYEIGNKININY